MAAKPPSDDDGNLSNHTRGVPVGRVRPATLDEDMAAATVFRPDAVLALIGGAVPDDLPAFEKHVAGLIDGVRPVARIKKKAGVSSSDLRIALASLNDRKLLRVTGIVEEAIGALAQEIKEQLNGFETEVTMPRAVPAAVPMHVMAEIQSMLDEDDE
ncbi:MAG TPA: hypothetical protein VGO62_19395 [Myxococcota bacterium]|jgi:hypothetical protein